MIKGEEASKKGKGYRCGRIMFGVGRIMKLVQGD
jgi:hypothetical protein